MDVLSVLTTPIEQIASLPPGELSRLMSEADALKKQASTVSGLLDQALERRYGERAKQRRAEEGKDTGSVKMADNGFIVTADLPKKVKWDSAKLAALAKRIQEAGDKPEEYLDVEYKVPERKYTAWPENIRSAFEPARTVETGKPSFKLQPAEA